MRADIKPVKEFILSLEKPSIGKFLKSRAIIEEYGVQIGMPHVRNIDRNLYELRLRGREELRFFLTLRQNIVYILHGFKKKLKKYLRKKSKLHEND